MQTKRKLFRKLSLVLVMALGCSVCWADYTVPSSGTWSGGTVTSNQTVFLTDNVTITGRIIIDGCSLTIKPNGKARTITNGKADGNLQGMFQLRNGATLYIGSDDAYNGPTITIGGGASWSMAAYDADGFVTGLDALSNPTRTMGQAVINVEDLTQATTTQATVKNTITLRNVIIQNVNSTANCAGVRSGEWQWTEITMTNCKFKNLKATSRTAVYACPSCDGSITMTDCEVCNCITTTTNLGAHTPAIGGWGNCKMHMTLTRCKVHHNYGNCDAGALYWPSNGINKNGKYATLTLDGCEFHHNRAANYNGGAMDICGNFTLTGGDTKVHHNKAHTHGGGISFRTYNSGAQPNVPVDVVFDLNGKLQVYDNTCECYQHDYGTSGYVKVTGGGGGVSFIAESNCSLEEGSTFTLKMNGAKIYNNTANALTNDNRGGGLYMENNVDPNKNYTFDLYLNSGEIYNNQAPVGGGLYVHKWEITSPEASSTEYVKIYKNTSTGRGGGMYVLDASYDMQYGQIGGPDATYKNESTGKGGGGVCVENGSLTMNGGNICYNKAKTAGGGVYVTNGSVVMSNSNISNNTSSSGGGVCVQVGSLTMNGGYIKDNTSESNGGGAYVIDGSFTMTDGNVSGNTAANNGGGAYVSNGSVTLSHSTLQGNKCTAQSGGALCVSISDDSQKVTIKNGCKLFENQSNVGGGACFISQGSLEILNENVTEYGSNEFFDNTAGNNGGAISLNDGNLLFSEGFIGKSGHPNRATKNGGGINVNNGSVTINGGTISYNIANVNGGGINVGDGTVTINGGTISYNQALSTNHTYGGGGGLNVENGTTNFNGGFISHNTATGAGYGGGIRILGGTVNISGAEVSYNTGVLGGGLIIPDVEVTVNFIGGSFEHNEATQKGGGIFIGNTATLNLYKSAHIQYNHATQNGGGVYMNGTMNVAGNDLLVNNNNIGTAKALTPCNVYLPAHDKIINIVDYIDTSVTPNVTYNGVTGTTDVGIYVDNLTEPKPVIASNNEDYLYDIVRKLTNPEETSALKDDRNMYQIVYSNGPSPFNLNQIFFTLTWQAGCAGNPPEASFFNANPIEINTANEMAWFMCHVNGLNGCSPHPAASGKLMADIDMSDFLWLPMSTIDISHTYEHGTPSPYTGNFDGNGYVITGLRSIGLVGYDNYGLFGETNGATVQNTFVVDCDFRATTTSNIGCVIGTMTGGTLAYSEGAGYLECSISSNIGGLVGLADNATIHSSMAMAEMTGYTMGGLVGKTTGTTTVENCFANPATHEGPLTKGINIGGFIGENGGVIENCYLLWERKHDGGSTSDHCKFAGKNSGTITSCYAPSGDNLVGEGTAPASYGIFHAPKAPYYYSAPAEDNDIYSGSSNVGKTLTDALNDWVGTSTTYSTWRRTMAGGSSYASYGDINHDYPIPTFDAQGYTTVGACTATDFGDLEHPHDGIVLDYFRTIDTVLTRHNTGGILEGGTLNLYKSDVANAGTDEGVVLYIDENVSLLQSTSDAITAVTCQTMTKPTSGEYWHLVSSSLAESPIGFTYGTTGEVAWQDDVIGGTNNPCNVSLNSSYASSLFPTDAPVGAIDLYSFNEPYYHWINLKRNSLSHWHMNAHEKPITYTNETELVPGKGYLAAIDKAVLLEASGTLNNGAITIPVTISAGAYNGTLGIPSVEGTELKGYNLLGNPYQSYLSFATFAEVNKDLWSDGTATFALYDAETDTYTQGSATTSSIGSYAASGDINMHQGFFILADKARSATFNNTMRSNTPASGTSFRGEERPAYPLINLKVTGDDGTNDVAVVEFDRPEFSSAAKMKHIGGNGKVYFHHNDEDCALLYLDEDIDNLPVRFETVEDGTYTLTWSTANATFSYLHLIDNMKGMDIDMLASEGYTFQSTTSDYASRFKLVFAYTGVEEESGTATEHFAFVSNGNLIVNGTGMFEMIDMNGRVISATRLTDAQNTVALPNAAAGVYVLKLTDSASSKVQKVVIR